MEQINANELGHVTGGAAKGNNEDWVQSALGVRMRMSDKTTKNMPWKDFVNSGAAADRRFAIERGLAKPGGSWRTELRKALETDSNLAKVYLAR